MPRRGPFSHLPVLVGSPKTSLSEALKYYRKGEIDSAIKSWQSALAKFEQIDAKRRMAQTLGNLGAALNDQGHYADALVYHRRALAILEDLDDRSGQATVLINLGNTYESLGEYFEAREAFLTALNTVKALGDSEREALARSNLGGIYAKTGAYAKAISYYEESVAIAKRIDDRSGTAYALNNLGSAHHAQEHLPKALRYYTESLVLASEVRDARLQAEILINIGTAEEDQRHFKTAIQHHQDAFKLAVQLGDRRLQAFAMNNLGHAFFSAGDLSEAEKSLLRSVAFYDSLRPGLTDTAKVSVFDTQMLTYNLLQQILIAQKNFDGALEVSEQGRARAFVELLAQRIASEPVVAVPPPSIDQIRRIARSHNAVLVEYSIVPVDEFKVQGKLRGQSGTLYIWVVQPTGKLDFRSVDLRKENLAITDLVGQTRDALGVRGRGAGPPEVLKPVQDEIPLERLYQYLIAPIADLLPPDPHSHIVFVPQESLLLVPFAALRNGTGQYLVDAHTILTAPAIQLLDLTLQQRKLARRVNPQEALIVGNPSPMPRVTTFPGGPPQSLDPLPGSEQEASGIADLLKTEPLIGRDATKARVIRSMPRARIIHLATHGILDDFPGKEIPGAVALAESGKDTGLLTAQEILDLRINPELVVLSACDTGGGRISGDGVIGLSRALISAGAPSVLVSLWKVDDAATATLMQAFYRHWLEGRDKAQALRLAMLETKKRYPDPRDWAAFTLIGEAR